jgi:hypothetical protein
MNRFADTPIRADCVESILDALPGGLMSITITIKQVPEHLAQKLRARGSAFRRA